MRREKKRKEEKKSGRYVFFFFSGYGDNRELHGVEGRQRQMCIRDRFNAVPMDQPGRYIDLRDNDSGDYWSASGQPVGKPLEQYQSTCRHGTAYTVIESRYSGIATAATSPSTALWGAEPSGADDAARSVAAGRVIEQTDPDTICDGLPTPLSERTFAVIAAGVERIARRDRAVLPPHAAEAAPAP